MFNAIFALVILAIMVGAAIRSITMEKYHTPKNWYVLTGLYTFVCILIAVHLLTGGHTFWIISFFLYLINIGLAVSLNIPQAKLGKSIRDAQQLRQAEKVLNDAGVQWNPENVNDHLRA